MSVPDNPKIYHILHVDRLESVLECRGLLSDSEVIKHSLPGTDIGMSNIKARRLTNHLASCPGLKVGECVPFYFCPRSIMLYLIYQRNSELAFKGGQSRIIHLECDMMATLRWAQKQNLRWAFTLSNAGSNYFEDCAAISHLHRINWEAVGANKWSGPGVDRSVKEGKQAEFLLEKHFPWALVDRVGVHSQSTYQEVVGLLNGANHRPSLEILTNWYY